MVAATCYLILILFLVQRLPIAAPDSIRGCGGFVGASSALIRSRKPNDARLDFSHVKVELTTVDGLVKDWTQCAPNGYYFIPVYDKGSYIIKVRGPGGWTSFPQVVPIVVDDSGCNANEDINFQFTGFSLYGRVLDAVAGDSCPDKESGPSGVNVELVSLSGDVVSSVPTTSTGSYSFENVIPGKYKLRAFRHDLNIVIKGSDEVSLGFNNAEVNDIFFVSGYNIHGHVISQGNPVLGVHFFLYSDDALELSCVNDFSSPNMLRKALCHAVSDAEGMFTFTQLPCGTYEIVPFYKGENTVFDVSPPSLLVPVVHDHVLVPHKFQVTGFSIGGRVVDHNGIGVSAAKVIVDGKERLVTDEGGYYKLDQVTSKRYNIEAQKQHFKFERLNDLLVLPNMVSLDDIKAVSYNLCGVVHAFSSTCKAKVALIHGPENVKLQAKPTDEQGHFCFEVLPGEYGLSASAATNEIATEFQFSPPVINVTVNGPLLSVVFSQAQVHVSGSVVCIERCQSSVSLTLVKLDNKLTKDRRTINLGDNGSDFSFSNVLPGKYRLEVRNYSPGLASGEDTWCWKDNVLDFSVGVDDIEGITFIQNGYWVNIVSSDEVDTYLMQQGGSPMNFTIKKGSQKICVESPGVHELHFVNPCIWFGVPTVKVDTSSLNPIYLSGEKYLLHGHIHVETNGNLPERITVDILDDEDTIVNVTLAGLVSADFDEHGNAVYEYSVWASIGEKLILFPQDSRTNVKKKILFYPRKRQVTVAVKGCQDPIPPFSGREGLYIEGSVSPPTSDVHIRIVAERSSEISQLKQGGTVLETATGDDGLFLAGPLYDDISYKVLATKPGYSIKQIGQHSFSCEKLGQISVRLAFSEDSNERFPSILLSLSSDDGYRNNSVMGLGGFFLFDNLSPGNFYLRPLLKEYSFSPPAEVIYLGAGESKDIVFYANRVAFSALGKVTFLSGQPVEGLPIEARAESKGFYEETMTDVSGNYRLRGLYPETLYVIKVSRKGDYDGKPMERASPEHFSVKIGYENTEQLDFVVFEQPEITILTGHVERKATTKLHSQINVEIRSSSETSKIQSIFPLPISNFFQVNDLPKGRYIVQLRLTTPSSNHAFKSDIIEVDLEAQPQVHIGPINCSLEDINKQELTPASVYPLVVGLSVIALCVCLPRLQDMFKAVAEISTSNAKKDVKKPIIKKKVH